MKRHRERHRDCRQNEKAKAAGIVGQLRHDVAPGETPGPPITRTFGICEDTRNSVDDHAPRCRRRTAPDRRGLGDDAIISGVSTLPMRE